MNIDDLKTANDLNDQREALDAAIASLTPERAEYKVSTVGNGGYKVDAPVTGAELVAWLISVRDDRVAKLKEIGVDLPPEAVRP